MRYKDQKGIAESTAWSRIGGSLGVQRLPVLCPYLNAYLFSGQGCST
jgi:hypothetical protein